MISGTRVIDAIYAEMREFKYVDPTEFTTGVMFGLKRALEIVKKLQRENLGDSKRRLTKGGKR